MPLPYRLARINRHVTNRIARRIAARLPPLALIEHHGRRSGRTYLTPVMAWPGEDTVTIALTYGSRVDWLANLRFAGEGTLVRAGRRHRISDPDFVPADVALDDFPAIVRAILGMLRVTEFVRLALAPAEG